jgi:hypothetical protein
MADNTGWIVSKITKLNHTVDLSPFKIGGVHYMLNLTDHRGNKHSISAYGIASGVTSARSIIDSESNDSKSKAKDVVFAEGQNFLKDYVKYLNKLSSSTSNPQIFYINVLNLNDKHFTPIPTQKSFLSCGLNVFSLKAKANIGIPIECTLDIYTFIAGHHFTPWLTSYYFIVWSGEIPILDILTTMQEKSSGTVKSRFEISFSQHYCPFIGMDSNSGLLSLAEDIDEWWNPSGFEKQPMISP